ncbi:hypothetical protein KXS07_06225 [Inquilinus limosus]|uniref:hypothetical protein n=1 Tax=Inquilinus limosus TaxID=171674 RepID=UPI003F14FCE8
MGITICHVHGQAEIIETCSHVAERIDAGAAPRGRRFSILSHMLICDECFDSLGFERFISLADLPVEEAIDVDDGRWEAYEAACERLEGRRIFCVKCVSEL